MGRTRSYTSWIASARWVELISTSAKIWSYLRRLVLFKRGVEYSRDEIARIVRPNDPPKGGSWTTGYARIGSDLFVFMNIGVPGRTGHDFENHYDEDTETLIWFSKPNAHSSNPLFKELLSGMLTPYFFARWEQRSPFTFLGSGTIDKVQDNYSSPQGHKCIRMVVNVSELQTILSPPSDIAELSGSAANSFLFEKHLEDFIATNWDRTPLAEEYEIYQENGQLKGKQFRTDTGPIDILAQKRDGSGFLVVELKRDRASDAVVGQTLRYMGWIDQHLCHEKQNVKGCIIAQRQDEKLTYALRQVDSIEFMRFEVDFRLIAGG